VWGYHAGYNGLLVGGDGGEGDLGTLASKLSTSSSHCSDVAPSSSSSRVSWTSDSIGRSFLSLPPCTIAIVGCSVLSTTASKSWRGTHSYLGCEAFGDALRMISWRCHNMYWFLASPRSSFPSLVGMPISHDSLDTKTTCTHGYFGGGGFRNTWLVSAITVETSRNLSCFLP
jgi:hypothetical protein